MKTTGMMTLPGMLLLAACSGSPDAQPQASTPAPTGQDATTGEATDAGPDGASTSPFDETFDQIDKTMGKATTADYRSVLAELQRAVAAGDKAAVAKLAGYPLEVSVGGERTIEDADQFVREYDRIITPAIAAVIAGQKFDDAMIDGQGMRIGNGEVWFGRDCADDNCAMIARVQAANDLDQANSAEIDFPLTVDVTLSDAATKELKKGNDTITVNVGYYGPATADAVARDIADPSNTVELGADAAELASGVGQAVFDGSHFQRGRVEFVSGAPQVNIELSSSYNSPEDISLYCDDYTDDLSVATRAPVSLGCKLMVNGVVEGE